jgi:hypothetical protein
MKVAIVFLQLFMLVIIGQSILIFWRRLWGIRGFAGDVTQTLITEAGIVGVLTLVGLFFLAFLLIIQITTAVFVVVFEMINDFQGFEAVLGSGSTSFMTAATVVASMAYIDAYHRYE